MTISWNQIPLEMRQEIVKEMSVKSRVNLAMCSKSDNQLVRGTKNGKVNRIGFYGYEFDIFFIPDCEKIVERRVNIRATDAGGYIIYSNHRYKYNHSTITDWRQTIHNIMSLIGTKSKVDYLRLIPDEGFQERFNWFRNNFHIQPRLVKIDIEHNYCYEESIFDWTLSTKIELGVRNNKIPNLERFNTYDKIHTLCFDVRSAECAHSMTDEILKKMKNAKVVKLNYSAVTINGFEWWLKNWLTRKDDNEQYRCRVRWYEGNPFNFENVTNTILDVIGKTEKVPENGFYKEYWKIEIKKNGKVEGIIILFDNELIFDSEKTMENCYSWIG